MRRDQVLRDAFWAPWSQRAIVSREENAMIGSVTFHGPPGVNDTSTPGAAEAARAMLDWAHHEHGITLFISGVAPENLPSLRVNEKLGFVPTGRSVDGELIFELHVAPDCRHLFGGET